MEKKITAFKAQVAQLKALKANIVAPYYNLGLTLWATKV